MGTPTTMPDDRYTIKDCCGCEHVKLRSNMLNIYFTRGTVTEAVNFLTTV